MIILLAVGNLAALLRDVGRYEEARPLYLEAIELRRQVLGEDHPYTIDLGPLDQVTIESTGKIIELYKAWNKPEKAKQWQAKLSQMGSEKY